MYFNLENVDFLSKFRVFLLINTFKACINDVFEYLLRKNLDVANYKNFQKFYFIFRIWRDQLKKIKNQ